MANAAKTGGRHNSTLRPLAGKTTCSAFKRATARRNSSGLPMSVSLIEELPLSCDLSESWQTVMG
jgi:hypothetical protein